MINGSATVARRAGDASPANRQTVWRAVLRARPLVDQCPIDEETGELLPVVTIVTDNGGPFRSLNFELFIMGHPELRHVRTKVRSPGQNGSRERGFGTLKYERLFLDEIPDALTLVERAEEYRIEYNQIRPHEESPGTGQWRCTWAWPTPPSPTSKEKKSCQKLDAGHRQPHNHLGTKLSTVQSAPGTHTTAVPTTPASQLAHRSHCGGACPSRAVGVAICHHTNDQAVHGARRGRPGAAAGRIVGPDAEDASLLGPGGDLRVDLG